MSQDLPWSTGLLVCRAPQERRALARAHQGCVWISSMLARLAGPATRMRVSRSLQSALTGMLFGKRKSTAKMRSRTCSTLQIHRGGTSSDLRIASRHG